MIDVNMTAQDAVTRAQIVDLTLDYARGIDRRDWALYRSIFADEVDFDFTSWSGGEPMRLPADRWVARVSGNLSGFDATHHVITNQQVAIEGAEATCNAYLVAYHVLATGFGENIFTLGGYYTHRLRRLGESWKIHACTLTVTWATGNRHLFDLARERLESSAPAVAP